MNSEWHISPDPAAAGADLADWVAQRIVAAAAEQRPFHLALSGGQTPVPFFESLSKHELPWSYVWLYWSDERCVPPNDPQSNYGLARRHLLSKIHLPKQQIERMRGEVAPAAEAERYADLLVQRLAGSPPSLDLILLGLGDDGHTASLFPGQDAALGSQRLCLALEQPGSGQPRLTMTPRLINGAREVAFLVTGSGKREILARVAEPGMRYPAQAIRPASLHWFVDQAAHDGDLNSN